MRFERPVVIVACAVAFAAVGCKGKSTAGGEGAHGSLEDPLQEVADLYRYFDYEKLAPPRRQSDLEAHEGALHNAWPKIQSGEIVVLYGTGLARGPDAGRTVLAYEKKAETEGGQVLMRDGTVKTLSAAEFQAAPRAGH